MRGKHEAPRYIIPESKWREFSKKMIQDVRALLWVVTIGGIALAALCIILRFDAALPWLSAMVGLPWAAHGVICSFYLNMAKSDHREGGVTFEAAKATNFNVDDEGESPQEF